MPAFDGKVVAITGAASGLGAATARDFASRGAKLCLSDIDGEGLLRMKEELEARGTEVLTEVVDVSQPSRVEEWCENTYKAMGHVDVLINNAGVAVAGRLEDMTIEDWQWILNINLWGVIHGAHYFYPKMISQGSGHIVNISSAAGMTPLPLLSAYCGTKHAVLAMTRIWRAESAGTGVSFTAVCPGFMSTNISRSMRSCSATNGKSSEEFAGRVDNFMTVGKWDPAKTAAALVKAVERDKAIVRGGFETKFADTLNRLSRPFTDFVLRISCLFTQRWG